MKSLVSHLGPGELWFLHHELEQSTTAIADRFAATPEVVRKRMEHLGIPLRKRMATRSSKPVRQRNTPKPNLALLEELDNQALTRISRRKPNRASSISKKELLHLHYDEVLTVREIAAHYRLAQRFIVNRMQELGVEIRVRRGHLKGLVLTRTEMERTIELCHRRDVKKMLKRHKMTDADDQTFKPLVDLTEDLFRDFYEDCQLSIEEIAFLCRRYQPSVAAGLRKYGVEVRPARLPRPTGPVSVAPTRRNIEALLAKGMPLDQIAKKCGYESMTAMGIVADLLQVTFPTNKENKIPSAVLSEIAEAQVDLSYVTQLLDSRYLGRGALDALPPWPGTPGPHMLRFMFEDLGLSRQEIRNRLRADSKPLLQAFIEAGIDTERFGHRGPFGKWRFNADELRKWVVDDGLSSIDIANRLGVSKPSVLKAIHRHHLPFPPVRGAEPRVRFDELTADRRVMRVLRTYKTPLAGIDPPQCGPLPAGLLKELIVDLGLRRFDIELLTGRTGPMLKTDMRETVNHPGFPGGSIT